MRLGGIAQKNFLNIGWMKIGTDLEVAKDQLEDTDNASIWVIDTIIEGLDVGREFRNAQSSYAGKAKHYPMTSCIVNSTL